MSEISVDKTTEPNGSDLKTKGALPQHILTESCATRADHGDIASDATPSNGIVTHLNETTTIAVAFPDGGDGEPQSGEAAVVTDTVVMISDTITTDETTGDGDLPKSIVDYDIEALLYEAGWENRAGSISTNAAVTKDQTSRPYDPANASGNVKSQSGQGKVSSMNFSRGTGPPASTGKPIKKATTNNAQAQGGGAKKPMN